MRRQLIVTSVNLRETLGAFTGGLNVRDAAFADLFGTLAFSAHLLGDGRVYAFGAKRCLPD